MSVLYVGIMMMIVVRPFCFVGRLLFSLRTALGGAEDAAEGAAEEDESGDAEVDARAHEGREEVHPLFDW